MTLWIPNRAGYDWRIDAGYDWRIDAGYDWRIHTGYDYGFTSCMTGESERYNDARPLELFFDVVVIPVGTAAGNQFADESCHKQLSS